MKRLLFVVLLSFSFTRGYSAYLVNVPQTVQQPDGSVLHCFASGDEFYNWLHDSLGYTIVEDPQTGWYVYALPAADGQIAPSNYVVGIADPVALGLPMQVSVSLDRIMAKRAEFEVEIQKSPPQKAGNNIGKINNIVVFIRFSDASYSKTFSFMQTMFNDSSSMTANSVYNFYRQASYGQLYIVSHFYPAPSGNTILSYQDIYPRSYYQPYSQSNQNGYSTNQQQRSRKEAMLVRAIQHIADFVPSSLDLDYDNDTYVDNVCFVVAGSPGGWNDLLWPHRSTLSQNVSIRGKRVRDYNFLLENTNGNSTWAGVITHEMMHTLGAPDLYRYNDNVVTPVGTWDLMASTNYSKAQGLSAHMKHKYGKWIPELPEITEAGTYTLYPVNDSTMIYDPQKPIGYRIELPENPDEYLVLEYRKTNACTFESNLPGSGLLIYRINKRRAGNAQADGVSTFDEVYLFRPGGRKTTNGTISQAHFSANVSRTTFPSQATNIYPFFCNGDTMNNITISNVTVAGDSIQFTYAANTLKISRTQVNFDYQSGNTDTFFIESNVAWTITKMDTSWLSVNTLSGDSGKTNIQLSTLSQNNLRVPKTCSLTIQYEGREKYITISQGIAPIDFCQGVNNQYDNDVLLDYNFQQYGINAVSEYFAAANEIQVIDSVSFYFGNITIIDTLDNTIKVEIYTSNASNRPGTTELTQTIDARTLTPNAWNTIKLQKPIITSKGLTVGYSFTRTDANFLRINVFNGPLRTESYYGTMLVRQSGSWRKPSEVSFPGIKNYSLAMKLHVCPPSPDTDTLLVDKTNLPLGYDSNLQVSFNITSNTSWEILNLPDGYAISQNSGTGDANLVITSLTKHREIRKLFYFSVRSGSILYNMTIERATYPLLSNKKEVVLKYEETDSADVYITATGTDWEAQTNCSWLRLSRTSGTAGITKIVIYPTGANNTNAAFEGYVDIISTTLNESISVVVRQNPMLVVPQVQYTNALSLYPNPAMSQLTVNNGNIPMQTIIVYNVIGKEVLKISDVNRSQTELDIANLQAGLYFVKVISAESVQVRKLVKSL